MTGSEPESQTGAILDGRYRLIERIGTGGMSRVYRAEDAALGRTVAIKLIADMEGDAAARAHSEVTLLASLSHPSLVTLFDAHIGQGQDYLVMEYVDGPPLSRLLREGPLSPAETAVLATELAEGLHTVHRAGIVHRDIKPSNVLLASTETPGRRFHAKLADFGIAYLLDGDRMTSPGLVMGTAAYLAPEQARGEAPTPAADIYALGLVLLETLSGSPGFPRSTPMESLVARQTARPTIPASVPPEWASLIDRMTAQDPAHRPSAAAVAGETSRLASRRAADRDGAATVPLAALGGAAVLGAGTAGAAAAAGDAPTTAFPATDATTAFAQAPGPPVTAQHTAAAHPAAPSRRGRRALAVTGAAAALAAAGIGVWALGSGLAGSGEPNRSVAPAVERTPSPEPTAPAEEQPAEVPAAPPVSEDEQSKAEEEQRKADEKAAKEAEKAAEEQRKAEEKAAEEQRKAEEEQQKAAEEDAEDDGDDSAPVEIPTPLPTEQPVQ
ncbi:serine/threonine protein kinase [Microbacterium paludicola]|uniref:non-specific serine/threonine protein kinase n=2 Tax=Microbacterium paludicola TaxID=300019 RepID=A0A4Y9G0Z0_9MICO|nr:serine/threonine-protein kinase [Microbacterium paludicola]MBF0815064.1 serine/threonine protein kinase [Microbacterium paludicola]TFU34340.1 serine/threonine protein kinase [Microbacterium paludicola]